MKSPNDIIAIIRELEKQEIREISSGMRGAIIGTMIKHANDQARRDVLNLLFGVTSSKELSDAQWHALAAWINLSEIAGQWLPAPAFLEQYKLLIEVSQSGLLSEGINSGGVVYKAEEEKRNERYTFD